MVCNSFQLIEHPDTPQDHDGLFEFGEMIACSQFAVQNPMKGSMSTPTIHQRAEIYLRPGAKWTERAPHGPRVFLGPNLKMTGGAHHSVTDQILHCFIKYPDLDEYGEDFEPISITDRVFLNCAQWGHQDMEENFVRDFHSFGDQSSQAFDAHFPVVNLRGIDALPSVAAGERCVVRFHVKNSTRLPLGDGQPRGRKVIVQWEPKETSTRSPCVSFVDLRDEFSNPAPPGFFTNLPNLPSLGSDFVQIQLGWREDTPDFSELSLHATLGVQTPSAHAWKKAPASMAWEIGGTYGTHVQKRKHVFKCIPSFKIPTGYADAAVSAIVIVSPGADMAVCKHWVDMLRQDFGIPTAIWNMQKYGHFEPEKEESLCEMLSNSQNLLLVVFDYPFQVQAAKAKSELEMVLPSDLLNQTTLRRHLQPSRSRVLLISENEAARTRAQRRLGAIVDLSQVSEEEGVALGPQDSPDEGHFTVPCTAHAPSSCCLSASGNARAVQKLALKLCEDHGAPGRRMIAVHKMLEIGPADAPSSCGRFPWLVGYVDLLVEHQADWDLPLEIYGVEGLADLESCHRHRRALTFAVVASLPRAAKVEHLISCLKQVQAAASTSADLTANEQMLELYVWAFLQEVRCELAAAGPDMARPVEACVPSLLLLNQQLSTAELARLPDHHRGGQSRGVHSSCYCNGPRKNTVWACNLAEGTAGKIVFAVPRSSTHKLHASQERGKLLKPEAEPLTLKLAKLVTCLQRRNNPCN